MMTPHNITPVRFCAFAMAIVWFAQPTLRADDVAANPSFSTTLGDTIRDHDFGTFKLGVTGATFDLYAYNVPATMGTTSKMTLAATHLFGDTSAISLQTGTISGLSPGDHATMQLILATNMRGRLAVSYTLDFSSDSAPTAPLGHLAIGGHALISPPGDYDVDGDVDSADYAIWRSHLGTAYAPADGNQNGIVDAADYVVWRKNYTGPEGSGTSTPGSATLFDSFAVPEPSAAILGLLGATIFGLCSRARRRSLAPSQRIST